MESERYTIGEVVTESSRSVIRRARESTTGREVAMKQLRDAAFAESFVDEAKITALLEHPNVVPVHEVNDGVEPFYTMKLVRGGSLADAIATLARHEEDAVRAFPMEVLLTIFQKICDAVAFAHSKGAAHCDLRAENIMIGDFGEVLLMGWSKAIQPSPDADAQAGQREDVFALGNLLQEFLPVPTGGKIPESLQAVVAKALATEPERRYANIQELQADVRAYQSGFATAAESAGALRQFRLFIGRHWRVSIAVAAGLALLISSSAFYAVGVIRANRRANFERDLATATLSEAKQTGKVAEDALNRLSQAGPIFTSSARDLMKEGRFTEALENLGLAVDVAWNNADYQLARAHLLQASQRLSTAVDAYRRVLELRPDASAQINLELCEQLLKENGDASTLQPALKKRLAESIIAQGRSAESPPGLFQAK